MTFAGKAGFLPSQHSRYWNQIASGSILVLRAKTKQQLCNRMWCHKSMDHRYTKFRLVLGRDLFNQNFRKFRSKTQWIGLVQPEKFRKNWSTVWGGPLFPFGPVWILVEWIAPLGSPPVIVIIIIITILAIYNRLQRSMINSWPSFE